MQQTCSIHIVHIQYTRSTKLVHLYHICSTHVIHMQVRQTSHALHTHYTVVDMQKLFEVSLGIFITFSTNRVNIYIKFSSFSFFFFSSSLTRKHLINMRHIWSRNIMHTSRFISPCTARFHSARPIHGIDVRVCLFVCLCVCLSIPLR